MMRNSVNDFRDTMYNSPLRALLSPRLLLLGCLLLASVPARGIAQPYFPDYVDRGIDSALSSILMTRYDLSMRHDATGEDFHRFDEIRRMFADPLHSFRLSDSVSRVALGSLDEPMLLFRSLRVRGR